MYSYGTVRAVRRHNDTIIFFIPIFLFSFFFLLLVRYGTVRIVVNHISTGTVLVFFSVEYRYIRVLYCSCTSGSTGMVGFFNNFLKQFLPHGTVLVPYDTLHSVWYGTKM